MAHAHKNNSSERVIFKTPIGRYDSIRSEFGCAVEICPRRLRKRLCSTAPLRARARLSNLDPVCSRTSLALIQGLLHFGNEVGSRPEIPGLEDHTESGL